MHHSLYSRLGIPASVAILSILIAAAEPAGIDVTGNVADPAGAAIPGAVVTVERNGAAIARAQTGAKGEFGLSLPAAMYTISASADGFAAATVSADLRDGRPAPLVIRLQVLARSETVTVTETANYQTIATSSSTKTMTPLINVPQSISVVTRELIRDQMMMSIGDVVRYVPGITATQGENNRDQVVIRGNSSSADFFVNGVRDDVQYYRDLYNVERVEALKGSNAMTFGRGGGGGVINRVTKEAGFTPLREVVLQGGSFRNRRVSSDFDHTFGEKAAFRVNGVYENSDSFRQFVGLERYGINPTLSLAPGARTKITLGYEYFHDGRTADRGIPSYLGRPADVPVSTFFGDPHRSDVRAGVHLGAATVEQQWGKLNLRNRTHAADYDRGYQNYVPGAVNAAKTQVAMSAYNNATVRGNVFNQTDLTWSASTGAIRHTLLWGAEAGRQSTDNLRNTAYFGSTATSIFVPYADPIVRTPAVFRQSATDADNHLRVNTGAIYLQDQVELSRHFQAVAGLRFDRFALGYFNRRNGDMLERIDHVASPRAGLIFKPVAGMSIYSNYSVSWLPSAGDQFSSLTTITQQAKPEKFSNYEIGAKWDVRRDLSLTTAVYRLDRTNTRATDPNDPTRILQTGSQRSSGIEIGVNGSMTRRWRVAGGYAYQDVFITSATTAALAGAQVGQAPHHMFSLWNSYQLHGKLSAGLGILNRSDMFAAIDNTVVLPAYTRADAAVFYSVTEKVRLQANVENLFDRRYYINADGNNNISPGFTRAVRVGLVVRF